MTVEGGAPEGTASPLSGPVLRTARRRSHAPVPGPEDAVILARGLTKRYGALTAVDGLDLEVRAGEIFGLLGPNGAGKTTTILMLLGLSEPTSGSVRVLGLDPTRDPLGVKRRVGYLPDDAGFYSAMTGRENLRYTARLNGIPRAEAETVIDEVLDQVGLVDRADDRVETYSRGMRQRLGIADALVKEPPILILDEPTTAIDPIGVGEILSLIRELANERGITILLASHLLDQVQGICRRVGIFHAGRLIGHGSVDELATSLGWGADRLEVGVEPLGGGIDEDAIRRVTELLESVEGVERADPSGSDLLGRPLWRLRLAAGRDERQVSGAVVGAVVDAGLRLDRFGRELPSLERIYKLAVARAVDERPVDERAVDERPTPSRAERRR